MEATQTVVTRAPLKGRAPFGRHGCPQSLPKANLSFEVAEVFHRKNAADPPRRWAAEGEGTVGRAHSLAQSQGQSQQHRLPRRGLHVLLTCPFSDKEGSSDTYCPMTLSTRQERCRGKSVTGIRIPIGEGASAQTRTSILRNRPVEFVRDQRGVPAACTPRHLRPEGLGAGPVCGRAGAGRPYGRPRGQLVASTAP